MGRRRRRPQGKQPSYDGQGRSEDDNGDEFCFDGDEHPEISDLLIDDYIKASIYKYIVNIYKSYIHTYIRKYEIILFW